MSINNHEFKDDIKLEKEKKSKKAQIIIIFILIMVFIPFFESKKVSLWSSQVNKQDVNIFGNIVNTYAIQAENIKKNTGLIDLFEKENDLWTEIKDFPVTNSPNIDFNSENIQKAISIDGQKKPEQKKDPSNKENNINNIATSTGNLSTTTVISAPFRFLLIGDSFMGVYAAVGDLLEKSLLSYKDVKIERFGKVSSGISRPDFFDWNEKAQELIKLYNPNIVIIMMGTNDAQSLAVLDENNQKKYLIFGSDKWKEEYGRRVNNFIKIFIDKKITVFWVGLPIMRENTFSENMKLIGSIYEKQTANFENAYFISTWELLSDKDGNYAAFLSDKKGQFKATRVSDGIHLTFFAGNIVVEDVIQKIKSKIALKSIK